MDQPPKQQTFKMTLPELKKMSLREEKISAITAYDYTMARIVDEAGVDIVLVGDSLGMVVQGHKNTLPVEFEHMLYHTRCVARGVERAHLMADMSFMSYQASHEDAVEHAGQLLKAGAESVKVEGGEEVADLVWYLNKVGIPTVAHIGLKPQSVHLMGGYKTQGKSKVESDEIFNDAQMFEDAGACMLLLEGIPVELAQEITASVQIPTIGIASGAGCDGQVLVVNDLLGLNPNFQPRFVRQYAHLHEQISQAVKHYINDVRMQKFPSEQESVHRNLVEVKSLQKK